MIAYNPEREVPACAICYGGMCRGGTGCPKHVLNSRRDVYGNGRDPAPTSGPMPPPGPRRPHDFTRFDRLMAELQEWRSDDHEDNKVLCRSHVIEIIEGVKALRTASVLWAELDRRTAENEDRRADIDVLLRTLTPLAMAADTAELLLKKDYPAEASSIALKVRQAREIVAALKY